jgi:hypothetical protein
MWRKIINAHVHVPKAQASSKGTLQNKWTFNDPGVRDGCERLRIAIGNNIDR